MNRRGRPKHPDILTPREWEVLDLIRQGLSNTEIAQRLGIGVEGVKYHVSEILSKLDVSSREEAATWQPEEARRWWAALPMLFRSGLRAGWLSPAVGGTIAVAIAAGLGFLVWALLSTGTSKRGIGALPGPAPNVEVVAVSPTIASSASPVFYVRDVNDPQRLTAYDWTGQRRGEIVVSSSEPFGVYPSEDGTMILLMHAHVVSGGTALGKGTSGTWAGDNAHVCTFLNTLGGPGAPQDRQVSANESVGRATDAALFLETTSGQLTRVVDYGSFGEHGGPEVLACDAAADRAIVVETFVAQQSNLEVLRLSDGQLVYQEPNVGSGQPSGLVASRDGSVLAEGSTASTWNGHDSFAIRQIPSGAVVAHISGGGAVAFSHDDTRVLTVQFDLNGGNQSGTYQVIDIATARVVWSAVLSPGTVVTRPHSSDFLVASRSFEQSSTRENGNDAFEDVWLVPADGSPQLLLQHVLPLD